MTRRVAFLAAAAVAATTFAAAAAGAPQLRITEARSAGFPKRVYVLTLPEGLRLQPSRVKVTENGHGVANLVAVPSANAGGSIFGTVLAVDTSNSMAGAPLRGAWEAARGFAAGRNVNQRLAILTFNRSIDVIEGFTTSQPVIERSLVGTKKTALGTRLNDAVVRGVALLRAAGIGVGSIIVLTDGADIGSTLDLDRAIETARAAHVRVFTVGLRSRSFRPERLERLAKSTGGTFAKADSPAALAPIYKRLGLQLSREYLVSYDSLAHPNRHVDVAVSVAGLGTTRAAYVTPALPVDGKIFRPSPADRVWQSTLLMLLVVLLVPALLTLAFFALVQRRASTIRARVSDYVSMPRRSENRAKKESDAFANRIFTGTEKSLERTRWWTRFKQTIELAEIEIPPVQIVFGTVVLTLFAAWALSVIGGPLLAIAALAVPVVVRALIFARLGRKRRAFAEQLPDNLDVLASALRAGHSLVAALAVVVNEAPEPSRSEFQRVVADEQLGIPIEDSLAAVAARMNNRDILQVALVAAIQGQTGGNSAEVLDRVTESIRERVDLRRLVRTLTAQGRLARWIVSALPVGLLIMISVVNPEYIRPLFVYTAGRLLLAFAALMIIAGSVVIGKIVDIKV